MKVKFRWAPLLTVVGAICLVAGLFSPGGAGIRLIADATRPLHRLGDWVVYTSLPDSQKWVNPDGKVTDKRHMCAGRDLLYNAHVDAGYVTRNAKGALDVMAVNSTKVMPMDQMCVRLPPDSFNGQEVSRFVVPDDPALSFLGAPGTIVWRAPFENYGGQWLPVWAGLGAFDAHHEWQVPDDFTANSVDLTLADFEGPGEMNIFNYLPSWDRAKRIISSKDLRTTALDVGGHGHMNWTFSKPGVYRLVWQAQGMHYDGSVERSAPVEQIWLVGEDGQVGLAAGTTKGTHGYGVTAEKQREKMGLSEPSAQPDPVTIKDRPVPLSAEAARALVDEKYEQWSRAAVSSGDVRLVPSYDASENSVSTVTRRGTEELPNDVVIEVPDSAVRCVKVDDPVLGSVAQTAGSRFFWATGKTGGQTPSYSVDTTQLDRGALSQQEVMIESSMTSPRNGVYAVGRETDAGFVLDATNANARSRQVQLRGQGVYNLQYLMSAPGVYSENGSIMVFGKETSNYDWYSPVFVVGNSVINAWRAKSGVSERLPENEVDCSSAGSVTGHDPLVTGGDGAQPQPGDPDSGMAPGDGSTGENPAPGETEPGGTELGEIEPGETEPGETEPGDSTPSTPGTPGTDKPSPGDEAPESTLHRIESGHIDLALGTVDGHAEAYVRDDSNPSMPVRRDSGTVAIVVPDKAWHRGSETAHVPGFENGAFVLPEVQNRRLPWPGLSNEAFDFSGVASDNQTTTFRISELRSAPEGGRLMMSATEDLKLVNQLDTEDLSKALVLPPRTHAHKAFWFNKPGTYEVEYEYSWYDASGGVERAPLVVTFQVGKPPVDSGTTPGTETTAPQPSPSVPVKPEPGKPAPSKPAPSTPAPGKPEPGASAPGKPEPEASAPGKPASGGATEESSQPNNSSRGYVRPGGSAGRGGNIVPVSATGPAASAPARAALSNASAPAKGTPAKGVPPKGKGTPPPANGKPATPRPLPPADTRAMAQQPGIEPDITAAAKSTEFWRGLMLGIGGLSIVGALFLFAHTLGRKTAAAQAQESSEADYLED